MSIYRENRYAPDDLRTPNAVKASAAAAPAARTDEQYKHLRRSEPVNTPLPATLTWFASLPADLRPNALLARYARIANLIAATWTDARALDGYMDSLLTDKRGNRQGFPQDVLREILALAIHAQKPVAREPDRSPWGEAARLGPRTSRQG